MAAGTAPALDHLSDDARLLARLRPGGSPLMRQSWDRLLFLNWALPVEAIRPLIPEPLAIDTYDGRAWISITPLYIYDARPIFLPPLPFVSYFDELNVRTYVHYEGVPGVWFFSLDANSRLAVAGARALYSLPYFNADIETIFADRAVSFSSKRSDGNACFSARWAIGDARPQAAPGTLDFFLTERYCLYTATERIIYRCSIHHRPWPRQEAIGLEDLGGNMIEAAGIPSPDGQPYTFCGGPVDVDVWPLEKICERS